ncbi:MAG: phosphate acyltransferase PlsX [Geminicoccaceae bacterium]
MSPKLTIALDAMGGDNAPDIVVDGTAVALTRHPDLRFLMFGDEARVRPLLDRQAKLKEQTELRHTPDLVASDARPSVALRQGRQSSMRLAINAVRDQQAQAAVSAGNTGALMAMAKFVLKTLPGIDRPAMASLMPARRRDVVFLDLGANAECSSDNLVQFAVMGEGYARSVLGIGRPTVGLLNIGTEDVKGDGIVREAARKLKESSLDIDFYGFVEGTDLTDGAVDVVVADGFTGNVALKMVEGTATLLAARAKEALASSWRARLGYLLARPAIRKLRAKIDPRGHNGAMFLGIGGTVVKSHGGTDAIGFANAIDVAVNLVAGRVNERIVEELSHLDSDGSDTRLAS